MNAPTLTSAVPRAKRLKVGGITPFSATDFPGKLAAVVFVQGCPWRCSYCHNPHLQSRAASAFTDWPHVLKLLQRRIGLIDAVVFSGGEPTIDPALEDAMHDVRQLGLGVALHTAGAYPRRLAEVLPLVDWVGLDAKATDHQYDQITGRRGSVKAWQASADLILNSGVPYEFRTTVHPLLHSASDLLHLATDLQTLRVRHYAVQGFRAVGCTDQTLTSTGPQELPGAELIAQLRRGFEHFTLRRA